MKTLTRLFILLFVMAGVSSCYTGIPLKQGKSENNRTYEVSYLFEHDGVKVYRFMDMGNYVYFTTKGDVTSIKNDSTKERTVTIYRDDKFRYKYVLINKMALAYDCKRHFYYLINTSY